MAALVLSMQGLFLTQAGCGPRGDAAHYTIALSEASTYERARSACDEIVSVSSRGDCQVAIIERFQLFELPECERILGMDPASALWRDECVFIVAEGLRKAGDLEPALEACVQTRFARQCAWHLIEDEANASLKEEPPVAEGRIARLARARPVPDAAMQFWRIRFRSASSSGTLPDEAVCATLASPAPCLQAFDRHVIELLEARRSRDPGRACPPDGLAGDTLSEAWTPGPRADQLVADWRRDRCPKSAP